MEPIPHTPSVHSEQPMRVMMPDTQDMGFCREVLSFVVKISGFIDSGC